MSADLRNVKSLIIVFAMPGCPACEDYSPRLYRMIEGFKRHGVPFLIYNNGTIQRGQIPVLVYDGASTDAGVQALCDQYGVTAMPTTVLLTRNGKPQKIEGAIPDDELYQLLASAAIANR